MVNNKAKGRQQQPQSKKGGKPQHQQQPQQNAGNSTSKAASPNGSKDKLPLTQKAATDTIKTQKFDRRPSLNTSLKRMNISNKKASKTPLSNANAKPNQMPTTTTTPRITSRDEDHKDDPMGHKKNQFGKMRLPESNVSATSQNITTYSAFTPPCAKCSPQSNCSNYSLIGPLIFTGKQFRKQSTKYNKGLHNYRNEPRNVYMNSTFVPIVQPRKPVLSSSNIAAVIADTDKLTIFEKLGKGRTSYPIMQVCQFNNLVI